MEFPGPSRKVQAAEIGEAEGRGAAERRPSSSGMSHDRDADQQKRAADENADPQLRARADPLRHRLQL